MRFAILFIFVVSAQLILSQPTLYPVSTGVIDVTKAPYFADNTGVNDASTAINQALEDFNDSHSIIFLPEGTYRIVDSIRWGSPAGCNSGATYTCHRYTILAGQGVGKTILKLDDSDSGYQDVNNPEIMIWTGVSAAMSFENSVRHLTISTGSNNPGVIALGFEANNQGGISNVEIISEDGSGLVGLHMGIGDQAGPCLIKRLKVDGFDQGIRTFGNQNSIYFEHIELYNQNEFGIYNRQQSIAIKDLYSENEVPVIRNHNDGGSIVTLINSTLIGTGNTINTVGILNYNLNHFFARNINVSGYAYALQQLQNGFSLELVDTGYVEEYTTNTPLHVCNNVERSLNLPIAELPTITYEDTANWVSVTNSLFGAEIDNGFQGQGSAQDDTDAFQMAFNSGASTIFVPGPGAPFPQRFIVYDTIDIPPTVKHLIGGKGLVSGNPIFRILEGSDTLIIEDFAQFREIIHASSRVLILKNSGIKTYYSNQDGTSGDVFIEDVVGGPYFFKNQNVWARQLNSEIDDLNIKNDGGNLWIFGHKTEKKGTSTYSTNGAQTEILGSLFYGTAAENPIPSPIHIVENSSFSIAGFKELGYINDAWDIKVREIRNGVTTDYTIGNSSIRSDLFVAYTDLTQINEAPEVSAGVDKILLLPEDSIEVLAYFNDDGLPSGDCFATILWTQLFGPSDAIIGDPTDAVTTFYFSQSGRYDFEIAVDDGALSARDTISIFVFDHYTSTEDHDQDSMASGNGADANIRGWSNFLKNYGGTTTFGPRHFNQFPAKSIFRIDVSAFDSIPSENCMLELEIATTNGGLIEDWEYNIFGLKDGNLGETWIEGVGTGQVDTTGPVNYDNAPGFAAPFGGAYDSTDLTSGGVNHLEATFLGLIKTRDGVREKVRMSSKALTDFINQDTSGTVTFLMTRKSFALNTIVFASKEHESFAPPTLYFDFCRSQAVVYVDSSATGNQTGDSWTNAYTSVNQALNSDCISETDTIKLATGTYNYTNQNSTIRVKTLVIDGGYSSGGGSQNLTLYPTILKSTNNIAEEINLLQGSQNFIEFTNITVEPDIEVKIQQH